MELSKHFLTFSEHFRVKSLFVKSLAVVVVQSVLHIYSFLIVWK